MLYLPLKDRHRKHTAPCWSACWSWPQIQNGNWCGNESFWENFCFVFSCWFLAVVNNSKQSLFFQVFENLMLFSQSLLVEWSELFLGSLPPAQPQHIYAFRRQLILESTANGKKGPNLSKPAGELHFGTFWSTILPTQRWRLLFIT